jgi:hypothetical protein
MELIGYEFIAFHAAGNLINAKVLALHGQGGHKLRLPYRR